ncbi:MAG: fibrobacter succinogenes major paralogous domain-containing protein [Bacteroidota bacterium]
MSLKNITIMLLILICKMTSVQTIISNPGKGITFDNYRYSTIILGNGQEWFAENLRTATYANGDVIPNVIDSNLWGSGTSGAWCHYANDAKFENLFGKLYNWIIVTDPRNVCPLGWHVPNESDWNSLIKYLDPEADTICEHCNQSLFAGGMIKSTGIEIWKSPNKGATNISGFSGLPGGYRLHSGSFSGIRGYAFWWSATRQSDTESWSRPLNSVGSNIPKNDSYAGNGYSIRCLKD